MTMPYSPAPGETVPPPCSGQIHRITHLDPHGITDFWHVDPSLCLAVAARMSEDGGTPPIVTTYELVPIRCISLEDDK